MRKQINKNNDQLDQRAITKLFKAASVAEKKKQVESFLKGLLTNSEQLMLGRRLLVAELLLSGQTQAEIIYKYKISPNTVWRINKWLIAEFPEYGQVLKETVGTKKVHNREERMSSFDSFTFAKLKEKYPMHFLLFNLADHILKK